MKRLFYSLIIAALVSTLAFGAEVRKLTQEDIEWGDPATTVTSAAGHVGHRIDNTYKLSSPWVDVRAYLPVGYVSDNSVNYRSYVQSAIDNVDNATANGGVVLLPPGLKIKIDAPLTITGKYHVWLVFGGWSAQIYNSGTGNAITVGSTAGDNTADIRILNGWIIGNASSGHGIQVLRNHSLRIEGMRISSHGGDGINFDRAYANWILNNYINNNSGDGFEANNGNDFTIFEGNKVLANGGKGVYFSNGDSTGAHIDRNDFEGNGIGIKILCGDTNSSDSMSINGNYMENQVGLNVSIGSDNSTNRIRNITISNNKFIVGQGTVTTNAVSLDRVQWPVINSNIFAADLIFTSNTQYAFMFGNQYNPSATFPTGGYWNDTKGGIIWRSDTTGQVDIGTSNDWKVNFLQYDNVAWTITTGKDFKAATAGKGIVLRNAADNVVKRVRLNDAGDGLIFEAE